ncbi:hypothetical protein FG87_32005 [Nocardia vulneris]|uniref:Uncharacterized protein n=1 Tax=Nocardia vulneris TaxID=1141657 RepID=A0ABR4Z7I9_9NOCA|nr:hypothetical protein FG87_32005 [Nocardia vulneris]
MPAVGRWEQQCVGAGADVVTKMVFESRHQVRRNGDWSPSCLGLGLLHLAARNALRCAFEPDDAMVDPHLALDQINTLSPQFSQLSEPKRAPRSQ